jgi:hypothetical protein
VFGREVVDLVLLIGVDVVFMREVSDMVLLIGVEVAIDSEVEDTTSLANTKVMSDAKVGAAAASLAIVAVVMIRGIPVVTFSTGVAAASLAIDGGIITPIALLNATSSLEIAATSVLKYAIKKTAKAPRRLENCISRVYKSTNKGRRGGV